MSNIPQEDLPQVLHCSLDEGTLRPHVNPVIHDAEEEKMDNSYPYPRPMTNLTQTQNLGQISNHHLPSQIDAASSFCLNDSMLSQTQGVCIQSYLRQSHSQSNLSMMKSPRDKRGHSPEVHELKRDMRKKEQDFQKQTALLKQKIQLLEMQSKEYEQREETLKRNHQIMIQAMQKNSSGGALRRKQTELVAPPEAVDHSLEIEELKQLHRDELKQVREAFKEKDFEARSLHLQIEEKEIEHERKVQELILDKRNLENKMKRVEAERDARQGETDSEQKVSALEEELAAARQKLSESGKRLVAEQSNFQTYMENWGEQRKALEDQCSQLKEQLAQKEKFCLQLDKKAETLEETLGTFERHAEELESQLDGHRSDLAAKDEVIKTLGAQLEVVQSTQTQQDDFFRLQRLTDENEYLNSQISSQQETIRNQQVQIKKYQNNETVSLNEVDQAHHQLAMLKASFEEQVAALSSQNEQLRAANGAQESESDQILKLKQELQEQKEQASKQLEEKDQIIFSLQVEANNEGVQQHSPIKHQNLSTMMASRDFQQTMLQDTGKKQPTEEEAVARKHSEEESDAVVKITLNELDLLHSCQEIIDAASSMKCSKCQQIFQTTEFYDHIIVKRECIMDSEDDASPKEVSGDLAEGEFVSKTPGYNDFPLQQREEPHLQLPYVPFVPTAKINLAEIVPSNQEPMTDQNLENLESSEMQGPPQRESAFLQDWNELQKLDPLDLPLQTSDPAQGFDLKRTYQTYQSSNQPVEQLPTLEGRAKSGTKPGERAPLVRGHEEATQNQPSGTAGPQTMTGTVQSHLQLSLSPSNISKSYQGSSQKKEGANFQHFAQANKRFQKEMGALQFAPVQEQESCKPSSSKDRVRMMESEPQTTDNQQNIEFQSLNNLDDVDHVEENDQSPVVECTEIIRGLDRSIENGMSRQDEPSRSEGDISLHELLTKRTEEENQLKQQQDLNSSLKNLAVDSRKVEDEKEEREDFDLEIEKLCGLDTSRFEEECSKLPSSKKKLIQKHIEEDGQQQVKQELNRFNLSLDQGAGAQYQWQQESQVENSSMAQPIDGGSDLQAEKKPLIKFDLSKQLNELNQKKIEAFSQQPVEQPSNYPIQQKQPLQSQQQQQPQQQQKQTISITLTKEQKRLQEHPASPPNFKGKANQPTGHTMREQAQMYERMVDSNQKLKLLKSDRQAPAQNMVQRQMQALVDPNEGRVDTSGIDPVNQIQSLGAKGGAILEQDENILEEEEFSEEEGAPDLQQQLQEPHQPSKPQQNPKPIEEYPQHWIQTSSARLKQALANGGQLSQRYSARDRYTKRNAEDSDDPSWREEDLDEQPSARIGPSPEKTPAGSMVQRDLKCSIDQQTTVQQNIRQQPSLLDTKRDPAFYGGEALWSNPLSPNEGLRKKFQGGNQPPMTLIQQAMMEAGDKLLGSQSRRSGRSKNTDYIKSSILFKSGRSNARRSTAQRNKSSDSLSNCEEVELEEDEPPVANLATKQLISARPVVTAAPQKAFAQARDPLKNSLFKGKFLSRQPQMNMMQNKPTTPSGGQGFAYFSGGDPMQQMYRTHQELQVQSPPNNYMGPQSYASGGNHSFRPPSNLSYGHSAGQFGQTYSQVLNDPRLGEPHVIGDHIQGPITNSGGSLAQHQQYQQRQFSKTFHQHFQQQQQPGGFVNQLGGTQQLQMQQLQMQQQQQQRSYEPKSMGRGRFYQ